MAKQTTFVIPVQDGTVPGRSTLDVTHISSSQPQVRRELLPIREMIGYGTEVSLHSFLVPVQNFVQVVTGIGRE